MKDGRKRAFVVTLLATTPRDGALILSEVRVPVLSSESRAGDASGTTSRGFKAGNAFISDGYINSRVAKAIRTASGSNPGASGGQGPDSSTRPTRSRSTRAGSST